MPRIPSIETGRVFAILAVLVLHSALFRKMEIGELPPDQQLRAGILNHLARFGVPYFFFVSGYLLGRSRLRGGDVFAKAFESAKRVILIWVIASAGFIVVEPLYAMITGRIHFGRWEWDTPSYVGSFLEMSPPDMVKRLALGMRIQLWFLPALAMSTLLVGFLRQSAPKALMPVAIALYAVGLAGSSYGSLTGMDLGLLSRNGPFFGTIFMVAGDFLADRKDSPRLRTGLLMMLFGAVLHGAEVAWLRTDDRNWVSPAINYLGGTALFGIGFGVVMLSRPSLGRGTPLPDFGGLTLGIYLIHYDVMMWLAILVNYDSLGWQFVLVTFGFLLSAALVAVVSALLKTGRSRPVPAGASTDRDPPESAG